MLVCFGFTLIIITFNDFIIHIEYIFKNRHLQDEELEVMSVLISMRELNCDTFNDRPGESGIKGSHTEKSLGHIEFLYL